MQGLLRSYGTGITLALVAACISGFAVFFNKFVVSLWDNSTAYTTAKNIVAAAFLLGLVLSCRKLSELHSLNRRSWILLVCIGFIGGAVPFVLFFKALTLVSAPEAAFIQKTLFVWVALLALPVLKEKLNRVQVIALVLFFVGLFLLGSPAKWDFGMGAVLAFAATLLWAIETVIAKIALRNISSSIAACARMTFGAGFLLLYLAATSEIASVVPATGEQALWAFFAGGVLFAYVATWYAALQRAPATIVSSVLVLAAPITAIVTSFYQTQSFPNTALWPLLLMGFGVLLFTQFAAKTASGATKTLNSTR